MTDLVFKIYDLKIWNTLIIDSKKFVFRREVILIEKKFLLCLDDGFSF